MQTRLRLLLAALPLAAISYVGCGGSTDTSLGLDQDAGSDGTTPAPDAAPDAKPRPDGGGPGPDATPPEGGGPPLPDAAPPIEAGGNGFCARLGGTHLFCDDFDEGQPLKALWDTLIVTGGAEASLDTQVFKSAPNAYLADTTGPVSGQAVAIMEKSFAQGRSYTASFDARIGQYGSDPNGNPGQFAAIAGLASGDLSVGLLLTSPTSAGVVEQSQPDAGGGGPPTFHGIQAGLGDAKWVRVDLSVQFPVAAAAGRVRVKFDGTTVLDTPLTSGNGVPGADTKLSLGVFIANAPKAWRAEFDNVVVDKGL